MNFLPKHLLARCYSSRGVEPGALKKWRITGYPSPQSLLDDDSSGPVDLSEDNHVVNRTRPDAPPIHRRKPPKTAAPAEHVRHREVIKQNFPDGWNPPRKISREAMDGLRSLHQLDPTSFTTPVLASKFKISPEAVRRILKGKWEPGRERRVQLRDKEHKTQAEIIRLNRLREKEEMERDFALRSLERQETVGTPAGIDSKDEFTFG